jgi:cytochrome c553
MSRARWFAAGFVAALGPLGFIASIVQAQMQESPEIMRGAIVAAQGTALGAPACAQCHAFNGASDGSGAFPRVAGQSAHYLAEQLRGFASGVRTNAIMTPIAKAMSPDSIADVSAYYASINAPFLPLKSGDPALLKRGEQLAKVGSAAQQLQSCDNCHGPSGVGEPPTIPYLAGQYATYIAFTLHMWRQGYRNSSPESMGVVARKLSDQDIAAVAAYYQSVHPTIETAPLSKKE